MIKYIFLLVVSVLTFTTLQAQTAADAGSEKVLEGPILVVVDNAPDFPGGGALHWQLI